MVNVGKYTIPWWFWDTYLNLLGKPKRLLIKAHGKFRRIFPGFFPAPLSFTNSGSCDSPPFFPTKVDPYRKNRFKKDNERTNKSSASYSIRDSPLGFCRPNPPLASKILRWFCRTLIRIIRHQHSRPQILRWKTLQNKNKKTAEKFPVNSKPSSKKGGVVFCNFSLPKTLPENPAAPHSNPHHLRSYHNSNPIPRPWELRTSPHVGSRIFSAADPTISLVWFRLVESDVETNIDMYA